MDDHMYTVMPDDINTLEDLETWKNKFDGMTYYQRKMSNNLSIERFGRDNITRYNELKARLIDNADPNDNIDISNVEISLKDILDYFSEVSKEKVTVNFSSLTKKKITKDLVKQYKYLNRVRLGENNLGFAFFDGRSLICYVNIEVKGTGTKEVWIQALEVLYAYRNTGLGQKLLDFAHKKLHAEYLSVRKNNSIAVNMYKKYGFKIYDETDYMYMMYKDCGQKVTSIRDLKEASSEIQIEPDNSWEDKLIRIKKAESDGLIIMIDTDRGFTEDYPEDSIAKLKDKWEKFQFLPQDKRQLSNDTARDILGTDNYGLYDAILNKHMLRLQASEENESPPDDDTMDDINNAMDIRPYYTAGELNTYTSSDPIKESGGVYQWSRLLENLYIDLQNTPKYNKEKIKLIKESIRDLGWNPEIPFSLEAASKTWVRYGDAKCLDIVDLREMYHQCLDEPEIFSENSSSPTSIVPIFVTLVSENFLYSKAIKWFTNSKWSHVSIGFESNLKKLYSFSYYNGETYIDGFSLEGIDLYKRTDSDISIKVYTLFVTANQRKSMQDTIKWYIENREKTKYNFENIVNIALNKFSNKNIAEKMICSQFVYTILQLANFKLNTNKSSGNITPADIDSLAVDSRFYCMYEGLASEYNYKTIDKMIKKVLPTLPSSILRLSESFQNSYRYVIDSVLDKASILLNN